MPSVLEGRRSLCPLSGEFLSFFRLPADAALQLFGLCLETSVALVAPSPAGRILVQWRRRFCPLSREVLALLEALALYAPPSGSWRALGTDVVPRTVRAFSPQTVGIHLRLTE